MTAENSITEALPCPKCGTVDRYADGRCRSCSKARCREYYQRNRERMNANSAKWSCENRERANELSKAWAAANREKSRAIKKKWVDENPEKVKAKSKAYYAKNSAKLIAKAKEWDAKNRDRANETDAAWRRNNPEKHKAAYTAWREKNRERYLEVAAAWRKRNPEYVRMRDHARREIGRKSSPSGLGLITKLMKLQRGLCPCCQQPLGDDFHMDHIVPLSKGGANEIHNIQLLRATCNKQKSAKDPIDFMQERGFLL